jgi:hypothetical protein
MELYSSNELAWMGPTVGLQKDGGLLEAAWLFSDN